MDLRHCCRRLLFPSLLAAALATSTGCMSFVNPVPPAKPEVIEQTRTLPQACRNHVYIFLINGMDPCFWANINGLRDHLNALGYTKTYYGQLYHYWYLKDEMCKVHQEDPDARFVLVGFSFGANEVCALANEAKERGISIDLLVYLGGNTLKNTDYYRPENVRDVLNILATGCIWNGVEMDGATTIHLDDVWHFGSPTHKATVKRLVSALTEVAARVPVMVKPDEPPAPEQAPTPRPLPPESHVRKDVWDFLKPVVHTVAASPGR